MALRTGAVAVLGVVAAGLLAGCTTDSASPFALKVGDCLPEAARDGLLQKGGAETVACSQAHQVEIYDALNLPDGSYPGTEALVRKAADCEKTFEDFVGKPYQESELEISYVLPTEQSWERGDREILCAVLVSEGTVTNTLKGSAR